MEATYPLIVPTPRLLLHDRYALLDQVGQGRYSCVWRAEDTHTGQAVAIKELQEPLTRSERAFVHALFIREAALLRDLMHPGIPALRDHIAQSQQQSSLPPGFADASGSETQPASKQDLAMTSPVVTEQQRLLDIATRSAHAAFRRDRDQALRAAGSTSTSSRSLRSF